MTEKKRANLSVSAVGLVQLKIKNHNTVGSVTVARDRLRKILEESGFFKEAKFTWIGLMYRYGENNNPAPEYDKIDKKDGELPIAIEIASDWIEYASFNDEAMLEQIFESTALMALIHVGQKYKLPTEALKARLDEIGGFPDLPDDYYEKLPANVHRVPKNQLPQFKEG